MLLEFEDLVKKYNMDISGVLHVGAHLAEEAELYDSIGIKNVFWVEGNPNVLRKLNRHLRNFPSQTLIEALVYDRDGEHLEFNITNYDGMSSSILEFGTHTSFSPEIKFVDKVERDSRSVDSLAAEYDMQDINLLNLDIQGAEKYAIAGATDLLKGVDYIFTEINKKEVYVGCTKVKELDQMLSDFQRVETFWVHDQGWGDGLYVRKSLL